MLSTSKDSFIFPFLILSLLFFYFWSYCMASTFSTKLNGSGKSRHPCLVPNLRRQALALSVGMVSAVGFCNTLYPTEEFLFVVC